MSTKESRPSAVAAARDADRRNLVVVGGYMVPDCMVPWCGADFPVLWLFNTTIFDPMQAPSWTGLGDRQPKAFLSLPCWFSNGLDADSNPSVTPSFR